MGGQEDLIVRPVWVGCGARRGGEEGRGLWLTPASPTAAAEELDVVSDDLRHAARVVFLSG